MTITPNTTLSLACPHCGSTNLASNDRVYATCEIAGFQVTEAGTLREEYGMGGSEVHWDSSEPANPDKPYTCNDCDHDLGPLDLLPGLKHPSALTAEQRKGLVRELVEEFIQRRLSTRELEDMATEGFQPFSKRRDADLREAYRCTFGDEELEQALAELAPDADDIAAAMEEIVERSQS